jgi:hypothetical protein
MEISDPAAVRITLLSEKQPVFKQPAKIRARIQSRIQILIRTQRYTRLNPADGLQKFQPPD